MADAGGTKAAWRRLVRDAFRFIPEADRRRLDPVLSKRIAGVAPAPSEGVLLGFAPLADEPDVAPFFREWLAGGGRLALPAWLGGERMALRLVSNLDGDLVAGRGGVMTPRVSLPDASPEELCAAVIPGRAFSESLDRMGRGAGCYDAMFRDGRAARCRRIGVAYDFQVFPAIPAGAGDAPMHLLLTPGRIVAGAGKETRCAAGA